jgi:APA family basic amino acid/polyamine antiporter
VHTRFKTPYIAIMVFGLISLVLQIPGFFGPEAFANLAGLYAFGSMLSFALAHLSILALRIKKPDLHRPFRLGWNMKISNRQLPLTAILGLLGTGVIWVVVVIMQPYSRWVGFGWLFIGLGIFFLFRRLKRTSTDQSDALGGGTTGSQQ